MNKMKSMNAAITVLLCGALLTAGCNKDEKPQPEPVAPKLEITSGDITADPSGQECSVTYTITDKTGNGETTALCTADWIAELDCTAENTVTFTVLPNETGEERNTVLTVLYRHEGGEARDSVNVSQNAAVPGYDYELNASVLTGTYYGTKYGVNGEYSYYTTISDVPYTDDGYGQPGGTYYVFDCFGPAPEDAGAPVIPVGTYTLGEPGTTAEFTFTPELSGAFTAGDDGRPGPMYAIFAEGTMTVSEDGNGGYLIEAELLDTDGKTHHVIYSGDSGTWRDDSLPPYGNIEEDVDFTAIAATAELYKAASDKTIMLVTMQFSDNTVDDNGDIPQTGNVLTVSAWLPYDASGAIASGKYNISSSFVGESFALEQGFMDYNGLAGGTYMTVYGEDAYPYYGFITSGTMTVTDLFGSYYISWDFTTDSGQKITGSYGGRLSVGMHDEAFSSLEGDITLDLTNVEATANYYGDWYTNGGGNWLLSLKPSFGVTEGDGMQVDLVAEALGFEAGIPAGTYTAGADGTPEPAYPAIGEYRQGFLQYGGVMGGTGYMGGFDEMQQPSLLAPAASGDLTITANNDGTYTLTFCFLDDIGNTWDGEWTGFISLINSDPLAGL